MGYAKYESRLFDGRESAEAALQRLKAIGYDEHDVSLVLGKADLPVDQNFPSDTSPYAASRALGGVGTIVGATTGGLLGAAIATAASAALIMVGGEAAAPVIAGPVITALSGFGAGMIGGTIVGGLLELGVEAEDWGVGLQHGGVGVIVTLKSPDHQGIVRDALMNW